MALAIKYQFQESNIIQFPTCTTTLTKPESDQTTSQIRTNGTVDPITDLDDIQIAKDYFLNRAVRYSNTTNNIRDYVLFIVGINCARRIGDIVKFKVSDFLNSDGTWKEHFKIKEEKR